MNNLPLKQLGIFGRNISYTLSPLIFSELSKIEAKNVNYKTYDGPLDLLLAQSLTAQLAGWNVTIPYKRDILRYCDFKSKDVQILGAANTISIQNGQLFAENTDVFGILKSLEKLDLKNKKILLLGAGGAARAAVLALSRLGVDEIAILNRNNKHAHLLIEDMGPFVSAKLSCVEGIGSLPFDFSGLIHARPYGADRYDNLVLHLQKEGFIFDMVYRPQNTPLRVLSNKFGFNFVDGLQMLVWQALRAWEIWHLEHKENEKYSTATHSVFDLIYKKIANVLSEEAL